MVTQKKRAFTVSFVLAMSLIFFGCDNGGGGNKGNDNGGGGGTTYYYSYFGIKDCQEYELLSDQFFADKPYVNNGGKAPFNDMKDFFTIITESSISEFIESGSGLTESYWKDFFIQRNTTPKDADERIESLNTRGNTVWSFNSTVAKYCLVIMYVEKE